MCSRPRWSVAWSWGMHSPTSFLRTTRRCQQMTAWISPRCCRICRPLSAPSKLSVATRSHSCRSGSRNEQTQLLTPSVRPWRACPCPFSVERCLVLPSSLPTCAVFSVAVLCCQFRGLLFHSGHASAAASEIRWHVHSAVRNDPVP